MKKQGDNGKLMMKTKKVSNQPAPAKKDFSQGSPYNTKKSSLNTGQGMSIKRSTQPLMKAMAKGAAEGAAEGLQTASMALKKTTVKKPQQVLMKSTVKKK